jgi:DNA-directed RNA polymerase subunit H (RpoH/RPB5)
MEAKIQRGLYVAELSMQERKIVVLTNTIKMLNARGWIKDDEVNDLVEKLVSDLQNSDYNVKTRSKEVSIHFILDKMTLKKRNYMKGVKVDDPHRHIIIILNDENLISNEKELLRMSNVELWFDQKLLINIIDHILVPIHRVMSDNEKKEFLEKYAIPLDKVPWIKKNEEIVALLAKTLLIVAFMPNKLFNFLRKS